MSLLVSVKDNYQIQLSPITVQCLVEHVEDQSLKVNAVGDPIWLDQHKLILTAITNSTATIADPGPYTLTFTANSEKVKSEGKFVLRVGDSTDSIVATPSIPGSSPTPSPVTISAIITSAGQTKVFAK